MTGRSIELPDDWTVRTARGRYDDTVFEFDHATADLRVRLRGEDSAEHAATYTLVVSVDGGERTVTAGRYASEQAAMETTEALLEQLQRSIRADHRSGDDLDAAVIERVVGRFRDGWLGYRLRKIARGLGVADG